MMLSFISVPEMGAESNLSAVYLIRAPAPAQDYSKSGLTIFRIHLLLRAARKSYFESING